MAAQPRPRQRPAAAQRRTTHSGTICTRRGHMLVSQIEAARGGSAQCVYDTATMPTSHGLLSMSPLALLSDRSSNAANPPNVQWLLQTYRTGTKASPKRTERSSAPVNRYGHWVLGPFCPWLFPSAVRSLASPVLRCAAHGHHRTQQASSTTSARANKVSVDRSHRPSDGPKISTGRAWRRPAFARRYQVFRLRLCRGTQLLQLVPGRGRRAGLPAPVSSQSRASRRSLPTANNTPGFSHRRSDLTAGARCDW